MTGRKGKSTMVVAMLSMFFIWSMGQQFGGVVIAKLPFTPFSMVSGMTHYGLLGDDLKICSMTFIFVLTNASIG